MAPRYSRSRIQEHPRGAAGGGCLTRLGPTHAAAPAILPGAAAVLELSLSTYGSSTSNASISMTYPLEAECLVPVHSTRMVCVPTSAKLSEKSGVCHSFAGE